MIRIFILGLFILVASRGEAQVNKHGPPCGGMDILDVGVHIKGYPIFNTNGIRYSEISADSLRNGFFVAVSDTSYRVKWFLISYSRGSKVKELPISGTKATTTNALFINAIKPGEKISLDCINIQKDGVTSLSTGFIIIVTK